MKQAKWFYLQQAHVEDYMQSNYENSVCQSQTVGETEVHETWIGYPEDGGSAVTLHFVMHMGGGLVKVYKEEGFFVAQKPEKA